MPRLIRATSIRALHLSLVTSCRIIPAGRKGSTAGSQVTSCWIRILSAIQAAHAGEHSHAMLPAPSRAHGFHHEKCGQLVPPEWTGPGRLNGHSGLRQDNEHLAFGDPHEREVPYAETGPNRGPGKSPRISNDKSACVYETPGVQFHPARCRRSKGRYVCGEPADPREALQMDSCLAHPSKAERVSPESRRRRTMRSLAACQCRAASS